MNDHIFLLYQIFNKPCLYIFPVLYSYKRIVLTHTYSMNNKIGEYRYKNNLTLKELSLRSGMSTTALSNLENGLTTDILLSHAITLSRVLHVDLYELFCIRK
nr:MAG TPA: Helix-turn-helix XRE-family like protein [Caudoviricetes sp.]DAZ58363.1 MAG TPA: Helix-turn-helix XRE-family like protein [Caudoviricetes sp.]